MHNTPKAVEVGPEREYDHRLYMDGFADAVSGDVECNETGHFYRIGRRVTCTNEQGQSACWRFISESHAIEYFEECEEIYARWLNESDFYASGPEMSGLARAFRRIR